MPRPKKTKIVREPTREEKALAKLCTAMERPKHEPVSLPEYMAEASEAGLSQIQLNTMGDSADARRTVIEGLTEWVDRLAEAKAAELLRNVAVARTKASVARRLPEPKISLSCVGIDPSEVEGLELEPFLAPKEAAKLFLRLLSAVQKRRWAYRFADRGCLLCGKKNRLHVGAGMCSVCYDRTQAQLKASIEKHAGEGREPHFTNEAA